MKLKRFFGSTLALALFSVVTLTALVFAQGTPFGNGRGAFRGDVYVPSVFNLWFGDNTSSDVNLQKNGSSNIGVGGHLGGLGTTANTTASPAGAWAFGTVASSSSSATVTFAKPFAVAPVCVATDQTTANTVKSAPNSNGQTVVFTNSGSTDTDVIAYACFGNPD